MQVEKNKMKRQNLQTKPFISEKNPCFFFVAESNKFRYL